jgi:RNA-directed DNA polymerase
VDDFVIFENSKERLHDIKGQIESYLETLRLRLHQKKCRVYRVKEGINFLGYRIFPEYRLLKKDNVLKMKRRVKKLMRQYRENIITFEKINQSIQSWIGHASHADTYRLRKRLLASVVFQRGQARGAPRRLLEQQSGQRTVY